MRRFSAHRCPDPVLRWPAPLFTGTGTQIVKIIYVHAKQAAHKRKSKYQMLMLVTQIEKGREDCVPANVKALMNKSQNAGRTLH
eukprot:1140731-Pelagomonas_calceolata.AAC.3